MCNTHARHHSLHFCKFLNGYALCFISVHYALMAACEKDIGMGLCIAFGIHIFMFLFSRF